MKSLFLWIVFVLIGFSSLFGEMDSKDMVFQLEHDLNHLVETIGERHIFQYVNLLEAARFLEKEFNSVGYKVQRQVFQTQGKDCSNLEVEIRGTSKPEEIVIVGAHYDSVLGCPGANDNGTGAVATLALARAFANKPTNRTLRFVEFVNEEPPFFQTGHMGSLVYAKRCKERKEKIVAMLSLETIGYYSDAENSQHYPPFFVSSILQRETSLDSSATGPAKTRFDRSSTHLKNIRPFHAKALPRGIRFPVWDGPTNGPSGNKVIQA